MLLEQLLIQPLQKIELIDPWPGDSPGVAGASLLAGVVILHFDQTAVVCTSPLRYMRNQSGTTVAVHGRNDMVSLGYRLTLTPRDDADLIFPSCLHRRVIASKEWMMSADPGTAPVAHVLLLAEVDQGDRDKLRAQRWSRSGLDEGRALQLPLSLPKNTKAALLGREF